MWFQDRTTVNVWRLEGLRLVIRITVFYLYLMHFIFESMYETIVPGHQPHYVPHILPMKQSFIALLLCSFILSHKTNSLFACNTCAGNFFFFSFFFLHLSCLSHLFVCTVCSQANLIHSVTRYMKRILKWNSNILIQIDARYMSHTYIFSPYIF